MNLPRFLVANSARLVAPSRVRLLVAVSALAISAAGFAAIGPGSASGAAAEQAQAAADAIRSEHAGLRRRMRALAAGPVAQADGDPTRFMQAVHEAASRSGVRVLRLAPRQRDDTTMELQLSASYSAFLRFAAELELLGATLRLPQIQAAQTADAARPGSAPLVITVMADVPRRAPASGPHGDSAILAASAPALRDPFAAAAPPAGLRDLSSEYKLSGITLNLVASTPGNGAGHGVGHDPGHDPGTTPPSGAGAMATINGMDFETGETVDGMQVVRITEDAVYLARGEERFVLHMPGVQQSLPQTQPQPQPQTQPQTQPRGLGIRR